MNKHQCNVIINVFKTTHVSVFLVVNLNYRGSTPCIFYSFQDTNIKIILIGFCRLNFLTIKLFYSYFLTRLPDYHICKEITVITDELNKKNVT